MANQTNVTLYRYVVRYPAGSIFTDFFGDWTPDVTYVASVIVNGNNGHKADPGAVWTLDRMEFPVILA
jgi:hypothetical protein